MDTPVDFSPGTALARASKYHLERYADIRPVPGAWRSKGLLPAVGLGFIAGPSGTGKSFMALDMALTLGSGGDILGHRTTGAGVVYVAAEAPNGVRTRVAAWRQEHAVDDSSFQFIGQAPNLNDPDDIDDLGRTLKEAAAAFHPQSLGVIFIDTLAASMPGMNENESREMSAMMHSLQALAEELKVLILIITHTGKDESRGIRGWSGQYAGADLVIMLSRDSDDQDLRLAKVQKLKDGEDGEAFAFRLRTVNLGVDADGDPITSAIPVYEALPAPRKRTSKLSDAAKLILEALGYLLDHESTPGPAVPGRVGGEPAVLYKRLRERAFETGLSDGVADPTARKRWGDALMRLKALGLIRVEGNFVWPTSP